MSNNMRILVLVGVIAFGLYILFRIRKLKLKMEDAIFWIFFVLIAAVFGVVPQAAYWLSSLLGIQSPINLVYLLIIGLLIEKLFTLSAKVSMLEEKLTVMAAEIAIWEKEAKAGCREAGEELDVIPDFNFKGQEN